jgi:hypothetical protein
MLILPMKLKNLLPVALIVGSASASSLVVNFTANLSDGDFTGPDAINPYVAGNALSDFTAGEPDVIKVDGQFYVPNYTGDGTYTAAYNQSTGNRVLLHSPLIERIEAQTWRAEGASNYGTVTGAGDPISQRKKFLLPDDTPNGVFSVTIAGGQLSSLSYLYDDAANAGGTFVGESSNAALNTTTFNTIGVTGTGANFGDAQILSLAGASTVPYGLNTQLSLGSFPPAVLAGTVTGSTRGIIANELLSTAEVGTLGGNISSDGRNGASTFKLTDPFAGESGTLTVITSTSDLQLTVNASQVPEPSSTLLLGLSLAAVLGRRKRS